MAFYPPCWGQFEGAFTKIHGGFDRSAHLGSRVSPLFPSRFFPIQSNYSIPLQSVLFTSYRPSFRPLLYHANRPPRSFFSRHSLLSIREKEKFDPPIFSKVEMKRFRFSLVQSSRTFCDTFSCEFDSKNFNIVFFIFGIFATIKRSFEEIWTRWFLVLNVYLFENSKNL